METYAGLVLDYYTEALKQTDIEVLQSHKESIYGKLEVVFGDVEVSEHYTKYRVKKYDKVLGLEPLDLPPIRFETEGAWIKIPEDTVGRLEEDGLDPHGGIHAVEHAMIAMIPYHAMCDRWDIGGVSTLDHPDTDDPAIFVYDAFEGGIGIAEKSHELIHDIINTTHELVGDCGCEEGCPSCIHSPKCGNENEPLDKEAALIILSELLKRITEE